MNKGVMNLVIKAIDNATPTLRKIGKGFGAQGRQHHGVQGHRRSVCSLRRGARSLWRQRREGSTG
jgi:hypothetical protein